MFDAKQAAAMSSAFDQDANYRKLHDGHISNIESLIRCKSRVGETVLRWVPSINKDDVPDLVIEKINETLLEAGYSVTVDAANIWHIAWTA